MSSVVFSQNRMTILPKKKSSQAKADRDNPGGVDPVAFPPRGLPPTQVRFFFAIMAACYLVILQHKGILSWLKNQLLEIF